MNVLQEYIDLDTAVAVYGKSERTIRRKLDANPQVVTFKRAGKLLIWMPTLHRVMTQPAKKGGRPKGSARPRYNTPA